MASIALFVEENKIGLALMFIGAAISIVGGAFGKTAAAIAGGICFAIGVGILCWKPRGARQANSRVARKLRNQLQTLLDEIGEEPKIIYSVPDKVWNERLEKWKQHKLQLVHKFRRRHLPKIQDFIHRLGEQGMTDEPLNLMIDNDPQSYEAIKEIADRLTILASRLSRN